tara:strand:+ start:369 stop:548 length:180 start_codon:yes stop_codon:yes gene_type:complete
VSRVVSAWIGFNADSPVVGQYFVLEGGACCPQNFLLLVEHTMTTGAILCAWIKDDQQQQ